MKIYAVRYYAFNRGFTVEYTCDNVQIEQELPQELSNQLLKLVENHLETLASEALQKLLDRQFETCIEAPKEVPALAVKAQDTTDEEIPF